MSITLLQIYQKFINYLPGLRRNHSQSVSVLLIIQVGISGQIVPSGMRPSGGDSGGLSISIYYSLLILLITYTH